MFPNAITHFFFNHGNNPDQQIESAQNFRRFDKEIDLYWTNALETSRSSELQRITISSKTLN